MRTALLVFLLLTSGCASQWTSRSASHATIYSSTTEIPVLWAESTFVGEVDGVATRRGQGYVLVEPGEHVLTLFNVNCPLPIAIVFCLRSAERAQITQHVSAGAVYQVLSLSRPLLQLAP